MGYYRTGGFLDWLADLRLPKGWIPQEPGAAGAAAGRALGAELYGAKWVQNPEMAQAGFHAESWQYVGSNVGGVNVALGAAFEGKQAPPLSQLVTIGGMPWDTIAQGTSPTRWASTPSPLAAPQRPRRRQRRRTRRRTGRARR